MWKIFGILEFNKNSTPLQKVQLFYFTIQNGGMPQTVAPQYFEIFYQTIINAYF